MNRDQRSIKRSNTAAAAGPNGVAQNTRFSARDAMNVGIFTALYAILAMLSSSIGFIPILYPFAPLAVGIVCGPIFVLFFTKVRHFGMITAMGILCGGALALTGHGLYSLAGGVVLALLADWICYRGNYRSFKLMRWGYAVFTLIVVCSFAPMFLSAESFYADLRANMNPDYANSLQNIMQMWVAPLVVLAGLVGGIIGAYFGKAVLSKHFQRAGVAG